MLLSNALFLIPFGIALKNGIWIMVAILTINLVLSYVYHASEEQRFRKADIVFALVLITLNTVLVLLGELSLFYATALAVAVAVTLGLWALARLYQKHYAPYHGMWHIGSVIITTLSLLIYLNG